MFHQYCCPSFVHASTHPHTCTHLSSILAARDGRPDLPRHRQRRALAALNSGPFVISPTALSTRAIIDASSPDTAVSFPSSNMADEFRALWEALTLHRRPPPAYRAPYWQIKKVKIMKRIDEVIQIANENDRYGEPHTFEEVDADDRWALYVAEHHERRRAAARALNRVRVWEIQSSVSEQQPLSEYLALENDHESRDADSDANRTAPTSQDAPDGHSSKKENHKLPQYLFDPNESAILESDSSDDEGLESDAHADDAAREQIFQLFEDFPTCIQKVRHLPNIASNDHCIMIISNPESGWRHIEPASLPPRIQEYLAEFTVLKAAAFPDGVYPDLALQGEGSHRWLLATARKEFICDTSTQHVWYRSLDHAHQTTPSQPPL